MTATFVVYFAVPSKIVNELSSRDTTVKEGETVTLICNVTGVPVPDVTWYKIPDDGSQAKERKHLMHLKLLWCKFFIHFY